MNAFNNPGFLLRIAIAIGYIIMGIILLINYKEMQLLSKEWNLALGALLTAYGVFRAFRAIQLYKNNEE
jgi:hypothetical protein